MISERVKLLNTAIKTSHGLRSTAPNAESAGMFSMSHMGTKMLKRASKKRGEIYLLIIRAGLAPDKLH